VLYCEGECWGVGCRYPPGVCTAQHPGVTCEGDVTLLVVRKSVTSPRVSVSLSCWRGCSSKSFLKRANPRYLLGVLANHQDPLDTLIHVYRNKEEIKEEINMQYVISHGKQLPWEYPRPKLGWPGGEGAPVTTTYIYTDFIFYFVMSGWFFGNA